MRIERIASVTTALGMTLGTGLGNPVEYCTESKTPSPPHLRWWGLFQSQAWGRNRNSWGYDGIANANFNQGLDDGVVLLSTLARFDSPTESRHERCA
jgi:hypothetical protein